MSGWRLVCITSGNTSCRPRSACISNDVAESKIDFCSEGFLTVVCLPSQSWYIYCLSSDLFSFSVPSLWCQLALWVLGHVSICTCPVSKRHIMMIRCVPEYLSSYFFCKAPGCVGWLVGWLVGDGSRAYTDLKRNWIRCGSILQISPQFTFLFDVVHLVHAPWLPISVALAFLNSSSIWRISACTIPRISVLLLFI